MTEPIFQTRPGKCNSFGYGEKVGTSLNYCNAIVLRCLNGKMEILLRSTPPGFLYALGSLEIRIWHCMENEFINMEKYLWERAVFSAATLSVDVVSVIADALQWLSNLMVVYTNWYANLNRYAVSERTALYSWIPRLVLSLNMLFMFRSESS